MLSAKSETSAIAPVGRMIPRPATASSPDLVLPGIIEVLSLSLACVGAATRWFTPVPRRGPLHCSTGLGVQKTKPSGGQTKKRRRLSPEAIIEAAIRLADAEGLEAVSIRRVAAELDGRAMSLYDHFASKRELLAAMADEVVGEMLVSQPLPEAWREAVAVSARTMYAAYASHPWALFAAAQRLDPGPNGVKMAKQMARALATLPLEHGDVWQVQGIVNDYVIGYSFRNVGTVSAEDMEAAIAASDVVEFPELAALPDNLRNRSSVERFELGLQTVLDGIEQRFLDQSG
jgi:AcrR family transcriptional regulator